MAALALLGCEEAEAPVIACYFPQSYMAFFDSGSSALNSYAEQMAVRVADSFKVEGKKRIRLVGHTDSAGSRDYNMMLSLRRAEALKTRIVQLGIAAEVISTSGKGSTQPLVQTPDGTKEPQNRRVEIAVD